MSRWQIYEVTTDADGVDCYIKRGELVRCKECKYGEYKEDFDDYECHCSGCGLVYDADFYCADGERKESE